MDLDPSRDLTSAVAACLGRYAESVDARDADAIVGLLTDDVQLTRGAAGSGIETFAGVDAFLGAYRPFLQGPTLGSRHSITNLVIEQTGEKTVTVRSYFEATMFNPSVTRTVYGRYEDDLIYLGGAWLIAHKRNFMEWAVDLPAATQL